MQVLGLLACQEAHTANQASPEKTSGFLFLILFSLLFSALADSYRLLMEPVKPLSSFKIQAPRLWYYRGTLTQRIVPDNVPDRPFNNFRA